MLALTTVLALPEEVLSEIKEGTGEEESAVLGARVAGADEQKAAACAWPGSGVSLFPSGSLPRP